MSILVQPKIYCQPIVSTSLFNNCTISLMRKHAPIKDNTWHSCKAQNLLHLYCVIFQKNLIFQYRLLNFIELRSEERDVNISILGLSVFEEIRSCSEYTSMVLIPNSNSFYWPMLINEHLCTISEQIKETGDAE